MEISSNEILIFVCIFEKIYEENQEFRWDKISYSKNMFYALFVLI